MPKLPAQSEYFITAFTARPDEDLYREAPARALRLDQCSSPQVLTSLPRSTRRHRVPIIPKLPGSVISYGKPGTQVDAPAEVFCWMPRARLFPNQVTAPTGVFEDQMAGVHEQLTKYFCPKNAGHGHLKQLPSRMRQGTLLTNKSGQTFFTVSNNETASRRWGSPRKRWLVSLVQVDVYSITHFPYSRTRLDSAAIRYHSPTGAPIADIYLDTLETVDLRFDYWQRHGRYQSHDRHDLSRFTQGLLRSVLDDLSDYLGLQQRFT